MSAAPGIVPAFRAGGHAFAWRGLEAATLDLDFTTPDRPALVTDVLTACAEPPLYDGDGEDVWRLSLAARIGGLVAVYAATTGAAVLDQAVRCPGCEQTMEVPLPLDRLLELARAAEAEPETVVETPTGPVRLRRPRGHDQRSWRDGGAPDPQTAVIGTLVVSGPAVDVALLDTALAAFDPLTCFEVDVSCPDCGLRADVPIDLEAALLTLLARAQRRTIRDVAALARRYGWTEAEVLAVPQWRRRIYLDLDDGAWP